jgi:hypothetical protein
MRDGTPPAATFSIAHPVYAWNAAGHKAIAWIGCQHLSPNAKNE